MSNVIFEKCSYENPNMKRTSPIVEVFSAMVNGTNLSDIKNVDTKAVNASSKKLLEMCSLASQGSESAISEINAIRREIIQPELLKEIKMLGLFGNYKALGYGESIEVEVPQFAGEKSRAQATNGDVVFGGIVTERYSVPTYTVSGGWAVDYRKMAFGDMTLENEGMANTRIDIRNKAAKYCVDKTYNSIKNATGVKFTAEESGVTKTNLDNIIKGVRRFGKTTLAGDYSMVSQIPAFGLYTSNSFYAIDDKALEEIRKTGLLGDYNGSTVLEIPNSYDLTNIYTANGTKYFKTVAPNNLLFILPTGSNSPIRTWTRGGLTSLTGKDMTTGTILTRFDLEIACDVAKGREYEIGVIKDTNVL